MKKLFIIVILTYLSFAINNSAIAENTNEKNSANKKVLEIGVLLPLSGKFQDIGESFLKAIQLALYEISNENIKIIPKDSKGNALDTYRSAREFEELGIKIVIGPIFYESLERLNEINNVTFIYFTNKTKKIPKNTIAFGINIESQIEALKKRGLVVNEALKSLKLSKGIRLIDFKLEFGLDQKGEILLADEISPDTCRFWDIESGEILDKDRFRNDLGGVVDAYGEVLKRIQGVISKPHNCS